MDRPYGVWINQEARFFCVNDLPYLSISLAVEQATLAFHDATAATCDIPYLKSVTIFKEIEALALRPEDRPNSWNYRKLITPEDVQEQIKAGRLYSKDSFVDYGKIVR